MLSFTTLLTTMLLGSLPAAAQPLGDTSAPSDSMNPAFQIVVNSTNPVSEISQSDLAQIFLGKKTMWGENTKIQPILLPVHEPTTCGFLATIHRSPAQYIAHWRRRLFSGGGVPPKILDSPERVLDYVRRHPHSIAILQFGGGFDGVRRIPVSE